MANYEDRINRVIDYIDENYDANLTLKVLSEIACFSEYHFQRVFTAFIGESPSKYINRRKIEKSINHLFYTSKSITEIAYEFGFSSSANYSKAFKKYCNITPDKCRRLGEENYTREIRLVNFKKKNDFAYDVEIENIDDLTLAYSTSWGNYDFKIAFAWAKLYFWAGKNKLIKPNSIVCGITYDNPNITEPGKLRYDACISVPRGIKGNGKIGVKNLNGGKYAIINYTGKYSGLEKLLNSFYVNWLPNSNYELEDRPVLQLHTSEKNKLYQSGTKLKLCIPVRKK